MMNMEMEKLTELSLWTKWKRPASVPYPNTWHRFTTKSKDGEIYKIKIVDLTPDRFEESMEFTKKYFYPREPISICSKLMEDEISFHNDLCRRRATLEQRMSITAVLDEDVAKPEIIGLHNLSVISKADEPVPNIPGTVLQKRGLLMDDLQKNHDLFKIFDTDILIKDIGLCVKPEYRGLNIGYNIVATIEKLARAFDVKACVIVCNSIESQVICEKLGYKLFNEIVYNEYKDDEGRVVFPVQGTKSLKLLAIRYSQQTERGHD